MTEKQKVLVVDDEKHICDNVRKILARDNYEVETAGSGKEALEKMSRESFSLLLSDMVMPGMNGLELLKKAKKDQPLIKALIMTAYGSTDTAVKAIQLGALDYITKPFTPEELRNIINLAASERLSEAPVSEEFREKINLIGLDMPFDADEVAEYTGEEYVDNLGRSDMPVVEVNKPEHYCEVGQMVCDIFKKMGKTCKAGLKKQECPQKKSGKGKAAKTGEAKSVKKLVGIDMPFNYDEVSNFTGPEYLGNLRSGEVAFMPYEQLKARMNQSGSVQPADQDMARSQIGSQVESEEPAAASELPEHYCEVGQMVCDIFKKMGKTCKAGLKKQQCPQKKSKTGKAAAKTEGPDVKKLIGVDMPFDFEEVSALTGSSYAMNVDRDGYGVPHYEELKQHVKSMIKEKRAQSGAEVVEFPRQAAGENILVIDDEPYITKNIERILAKRGYAVEQAVTRDQALEKISEKSYNLVLLDLKIPGVKGMEMLKAVREHMPEAQVIIITGYASIESAKESARLGVFDYLHKPFTPDEIRNAAESALTMAA